MAERREDFVDNFTNGESWLRLIFMVLFACVLYLVIAPVILVIMVVQAVFALITGDSNLNLRAFSAALSKYVYQILQFLTYNNERKPFPFADFPTADDGSSSKPAPKSDAAKSGSSGSTRKTATKKSVKKKKAARPAAKKARSSGNGAADKSER